MTENELRKRVVDIMEAWVGGKKGGAEHKEIISIYNSRLPLPRGYSMTLDDSYCAATVSAAWIKAGISFSTPIECSCNKLIEQAREMGIWEEDDAHVPKIGDAILYDWGDTGSGDNTGLADHIGIVTEAKDGVSVTVVEGNANGGRISRRYMTVDGKFIRGYILPDYAGIAEEMTAKEPKEVGRMRYYKHRLYDYVTIVEIPRSAVRKIDFAPTSQPREKLLSFYNRQEDKPDVLCNAGFFSMTDGTPCFGQIDEGQTRVKDTGYYGFGIDYSDVKSLRYGAFTRSWKDFLSGYPVLVVDGKAQAPWKYATELNYKAVREIVGYNDEMIYVVHVGKPGMNFNAEAALMIELGCKYAINLDGGGSARTLVKGKTVGSPVENRAVDSVLCFWLEESASKTVNPYPAPSDGTFVKFKLARQESAYWVQWELTNRGYDTGGIDGYFWSKSVSALKAFQEDNGLEVDGVAGPETYAALRKTF